MAQNAEDKFPILLDMTIAGTLIFEILLLVNVFTKQNSNIVLSFPPTKD